MGDHLDKVRRTVGKVTTVVEQTYEAAPTIDNFFYHHNGSIPATQSGGMEIRMRIPPGNYEIEAIARLYNNSDSRVIYTGTLEFFLEDTLQDLWEGGEMGSTADSKPYILHFRTMSYFSKAKVIKFKIQSTAPNAFLVDKPSIFVRRTGSIKFEVE